VSQEPTLFQTTIFENIVLGRPSATEEEVYEAAKRANAHKFISIMPAGYNTQVGGWLGGCPIKVVSCLALRDVAV
jgi:ABC-type multidrug transport system fused ATPase/permease subunit